MQDSFSKCSGLFSGIHDKIQRQVVQVLTASVFFAHSLTGPGRLNRGNIASSLPLRYHIAPSLNKGFLRLFEFLHPSEDYQLSFCLPFYFRCLPEKVIRGRNGLPDSRLRRFFRPLSVVKEPVWRVAQEREQ